MPSVAIPLSPRVKKQVINSSILRGFVISSSMLRCVCVRERERAEREGLREERGWRERERARARERERGRERRVCKHAGERTVGRACISNEAHVAHLRLRAADTAAA